ncbi:hypothetical protein ACF08M_40500 [Streptomyces sp. NPDC015032]|uniref:hypothetical protein n=1 Tax=Streptomyces sp. NPDC015032 TaxID=3364937 RepID=UPI0036F595A4
MFFFAGDLAGEYGAVDKRVGGGEDQALQCTVADLMQAEPVAVAEASEEQPQSLAAGEVPRARPGPVRPVPRRDGPRRLLPPN